MTDFAEMRTLDIWYARLSEQDLMTAIDRRSTSRQDGERQGDRRPRRSEGAPRRRPEGAHP